MDDLVCCECRKPVTAYSYENDYLCSSCGFVDVVRVRDGAVLSGDGHPGTASVIGHVGDMNYPFDEAMLRVGVQTW